MGKSTVVAEFGRNEYRSCLVVDFALAPPAVHALLDGLPDLNCLFLRARGLPLNGTMSRMKAQGLG